MPAHDNEVTFGQALRRALQQADINQAELATFLHIDAGRVSRWATGKAVPHAKTVTRIEEYLGVDLSTAYSQSAPTYELYVSAPITGLERDLIPAHHRDVSTVVAAARGHVNELYWPGEAITHPDDLAAPDLATERNFKALSRCPAFLYLQFSDIVRPSSALVELGLALGRRMKTTIILQKGLTQPFMLEGFAAVAADLQFLPKARVYRVESVEEARILIEHNGRELLGLT